jgi:hypothetical protein
MEAVNGGSEYSLSPKFLFQLEPRLDMPEATGNAEFFATGGGDMTGAARLVYAERKTVSFSARQRERMAALGADRIRFLTAASLAVLLSACQTNETRESRSVYDEPTLSPGETVTCESNPCTVYFQSPEGSGTHDVVLDGGSIKAGVAIGGKRVSLGEYYGGEHVFRVEGTDLPAAYLNVLGRGQ